MNSLTLKKEGPVFVVTMTNGKKANAFTDAVLDEHLRILDEIESSTENGSVILTSDDPKFWCNGIDLEWLLTRPSDYFQEFKKHIDKMMLRWALLRFPTVACITGHAYAGGAILACGFDFRLMRKDRGFFCFPEVDIKIPFTDAMYALIGLLPNKQALWNLAFTGRRVGGEEAHKLNIVSEIHGQEDLFPKTMELAQRLSEKDRATYVNIKHGLKHRLLPHWEKYQR